MSELKSIVNKIVSSGKGILAADESTGTMTKRLESVNVKSTSDNIVSNDFLYISVGSLMYCRIISIF